MKISTNKSLRKTKKMKQEEKSETIKAHKNISQKNILFPLPWYFLMLFILCSAKDLWATIKPNQNQVWKLKVFFYGGKNVSCFFLLLFSSSETSCGNNENYEWKQLFFFWFKMSSMFKITFNFLISTFP